VQLLVQRARMTGAIEDWVAADETLAIAFEHGPKGGGPVLTALQLDLSLHRLERAEQRLQEAERAAIQLPSHKAAVEVARDELAAQRGRLDDAPGVSLLVVIISDEADCSYNKDYAEIFEQDGNRVFWSDPAAEFPTSAVCWNAGVSCSGDPSNYDSCDPVNKDVNGNEGVDDAEAVLHPISRYLDHLAEVQEQIREIDPSGAVRVWLIAGVAADGSVHYAEVGETDPEYQNNFGIGPAALRRRPWVRPRTSSRFRRCACATSRRRRAGPMTQEELRPPLGATNAVEHNEPAHPSEGRRASRRKLSRAKSASAKRTCMAPCEIG
jgi:hypothetical protein